MTERNASAAPGPSVRLVSDTVDHKEPRFSSLLPHLREPLRRAGFSPGLALRPAGELVAGDENLRWTSQAAAAVRVAAAQESEMLGFVTIFAAALAGFVGVGVWAVAACALALTLLSYAEHHPLYRHGHELGLYSVLRSAVLRSFANGLVVAGGAYACGYLFRLA